jgi:hypothetical protein
MTDIFGNEIKPTYLVNEEHGKNSFVKGDKLIFVHYGEVLSADIGNVFTFSNYKDELKMYWQCEELLSMGNTVHGFATHVVEKFDPSVHTKFRIMNTEELQKDINDFIKKYGGE